MCQRMSRIFFRLEADVKKEYLLVLGLVAVIGGLLFFDQVMAVFQGMTPLDAIQTIWQFILHVTVGTIFAYLIIGLPEIVKPWVRMLRRRRRIWRAGPDARGESQNTPRMPRLTAEQRTILLLQQLQNGGGKHTPPLAPPHLGKNGEGEHPLDLKF